MVKLVSMLNDNEFPPLPSQAQRKTRSATKGPRRREASHLAKKREHSTTSLTNLPDELLVEILDYLPGIDLYNFQLLTLTSLSLTNRRLHYIVSDRLYATYDSFFCAPYPFLRTVISNPGLASHVKSILFRYGPNVHAERPTYAPSIADKQLLKDGLKKLNIPMFDWKQWASYCNDQNVEQEHLYATILLYTPNVTSIEIDDGALSVVEQTAYKFPRWLQHLRQIVSGRPPGRTHRFEHLSSIRIDVHYLKLRHLVPIFRLRSMRKVRLIGLVEWAHTKEDDPVSLQRLLPARASFIDELYLEKSFIQRNILDVLISSISRLSIFQYWSTDDGFEANGHGSDDYWGISTEQGYERYEENDATNDFRSIIKSLESHRSSLKTFSFRDELRVTSHAVAPGILCSFAKLTHLEIPMARLVECGQYGNLPAKNGHLPPLEAERIVENLPRSVQHLTMHIKPPQDRFYQALLDYLALNYREYTPALQEIKIIQCGSRPAAWTYWRHFRKLLDGGILFNFEWADADYDDGRWLAYDSGEESDSTSDEESLYSD